MPVPVSVVIPCFRCAGTVQRAVESVLAQTQQPGEVILVDDASTDDTPQVLEGLVASLMGATEISVITLPTNAGAASARNAGWHAAKHEYVAFLDADAIWFPRKLEVQYRFMQEHPDITLSGHLHVISPAAPPQPLGEDKPKIVTLYFRDFLWRNRFITSSAMIRRSAPLRFKEGQRHMEDHRLWLDLAQAHLGVARIESQLAAHYKADFGEGGLSADLLNMERAELGNYGSLFRRGAIPFRMFAVLLLWSLVKFVRRLLIVGVRSLCARETPGK